jgi:hypothetical protein
MQFGPTMRMPCAASFALSFASSVAPPFPTSLNPAVMTTSPRTPFALFRNRDDGQIDRGRDLRDRAVAADGVDRVGVRIHGVDRTLELEADEVRQDLAADRLPLAGCPDDRDGARPEDRIERARGAQRRTPESR